LDKKNYIITKSDSVNYLQFKKLLEHSDKLFHAFTLRQHNIGFWIDGQEDVRKNSYIKISNEFDIDVDNIVQAHQTHSDNIQDFNSSDINVAVFNSPLEGLKKIYYDVDAFSTNISNLATIITTADCMPIMLYDPVKNVYANIHSGWKGVINKISLKATKYLLSKYDSNPEDIICCIGPNILKDHFIVGEDVKNIYEKTFPDYEIEQLEDSEEYGHQYRIDNNYIVKKYLSEIGICNIEECNLCTVCNKDKFHSCRGDGEGFQRNGSIMMLR